MPDSTDAYLAHLKELYQVKTDQQLAGKLGTTKAAVANWRRRDVVPASVQLKVSEDFGGRHFGWVLQEDVKRRRMEDNVFAVALHVYEENRFRWQLESVPATREMWGFIFADVQELIRSHIRDKLADVPTGRQLIERCIADVEAGRVEGLELALNPHHR